MPQDTYDFNRIDLNEIYSLFHTKDERRLDSVKEFIEAENYMKAIHKLNEFSSSNERCYFKGYPFPIPRGYAEGHFIMEAIYQKE